MSNKAVVWSVIGVVLVCGLVAGFRWVYYMRTSSAKNSCLNNLRQIDGATQQWALDHNATTNAVITMKDIQPYIGHGLKQDTPKCPEGGTYTVTTVNKKPKYSIGAGNHVLP